MEGTYDGKVTYRDKDDISLFLRHWEGVDTVSWTADGKVRIVVDSSMTSTDKALWQKRQYFANNQLF